MQAVHHKTPSCSVIAKGRKYSGDKFKRLSDAIDAAGEKGAQLQLKIKAMHYDVSRGAKSNVLAHDEIACILMQRQWYLKSLDSEAYGNQCLQGGVQGTFLVL
jgi:hypothetical protein